jgi:deazaflavin-dependent oxidoreductase (nitroreductase family)
MSSDLVGEELAAWGKVAILEVRGRRTGRALRTAVGFVEDEDGSILTAAGEPDADWALNLIEHGTAIVTIGERTGPYEAAELSGAEREAVIARLILRYGTPAEGLGRGPVFRLRPIASVTG